MGFGDCYVFDEGVEIGVDLFGGGGEVVFLQVVDDAFELGEGVGGVLLTA